MILIVLGWFINNEAVSGLLENKKVKINSDRFAGGISFEELYAGINTLKNSYVAGNFFTEEELNSLASDYINGIKDVLGHASISTTQIYIRDEEERANKILDSYSVSKLN